MKVEDVTKLGKRLWKYCKDTIEDSRGASDSLCTLWNNKEVCLDFSFKTQHWLLTKFKSMKNNNFFLVINVYILVNPMEKAICWRPILNLKYSEFYVDCIIDGDFNFTRNNVEKRGDDFCWDLF